MATNAGQSFNIGTFKGNENVFFSETRNMIEPKLYMSNYWMVPYII